MVEIRNAVPSDLDDMARVYMACFNEPPWNDNWSFEAARDRLEAILETRHFRGAIAIADGGVVGLLVGQRERWVDAFQFYLQEMCVLPRKQRGGIGRALVTHITEQLKREGTERAFLLTAPDSAAANFYASLGFYTTRGRVLMASVLKKS